MLELQDLFDSYELMVWSFMDVERQEFLFYSPRQCHSSRNSSSDQCDTDAHLLTYLSVLNSHQLISSQLSLSMGSVKLACTVVLPAYMEAEVKAELNKKAHSVWVIRFRVRSSYGYAWWWTEMERSLRLALVDHHRITDQPVPVSQAENLLLPVRISNDINIELSKEFFVELRNNIYHGTYNKDVVDHIAKVLKMVDLIYVPGVDSHQLRMKIFPLPLADYAIEWWISMGDRKVTTWEELIEKFFCRFYPESYHREDEMLDEGEN
ncbi:hypothetical protein Tco_0908958 [Tanacetum coccineum]|uniref:Uncharacterized protein n=1 Tax=Tanacetum coccineum TaxID=301880 RepID=A0ABQ5CQS3_9ASTR